MNEAVNTAAKPSVSVVIPVYCSSPQHEAYLRQTLQSVAQQTHKNMELIIVDDVSPRDIRPLVESVASLPPTRIIRNAANLGHAKSRNKGIEAAQAELIAFLDHDDIWLPEKLEEQMRALEENPAAAMVFCRMEVFGKRAHRLNIDQSIIPRWPDFYWFICHGNFTISASACMIRKTAMEDIGLFDSRYTTCDDWDAWLKITMRHRVLYLPRVLAKYHLHDMNANYGSDRLNDNKLITALMWRYWYMADPMMKLKLLPRIARKLVGRVYFTFARYKKFAD